MTTTAGDSSFGYYILFFLIVKVIFLNFIIKVSRLIMYYNNT